MLKELVNDLIRHLKENYDGDEAMYITSKLSPKPMAKPKIVETPPRPEPPKQKPALEDNDLRNILQTNIRLKSDVLKEVHAEWVNFPIVILSFGETEKEKALLYNLATAIDRVFLPATVVPHSQFFLSDKTKLILSPPGLQKVPNYRMSPVTQEHFIGDIPVMLLQAPSQYLKNPSLKKQLWQAICTRLSS